MGTRPPAGDGGGLRRADQQAVGLGQGRQQGAVLGAHGRHHGQAVAPGAEVARM